MHAFESGSKHSSCSYDAEIQQDVSERVNRAAAEMVVSGGGEKDGERRECDEMMDFLFGMRWLVSPCGKATPPPCGEKEPYSCRLSLKSSFTSYQIVTVIT